MHYRNEWLDPLPLVACIVTRQHTARKVILDEWSWQNTDLLSAPLPLITATGSSCCLWDVKFSSKFYPNDHMLSTVTSQCKLRNWYCGSNRSTELVLWLCATYFWVAMVRLSTILIYFMVDRVTWRETVILLSFNYDCSFVQKLTKLGFVAV